MILVWAIAIVVLIFGLTALVGAPYVPSHRSEVVKAFKELRPLSEKDLLVDIGSGDGVVLGLAAEQGSKSLGIEINPMLVVISRLRTGRYKDLVRVRLGSFWQARFPDETTVVYTFGESRDINRMYKKVQAESSRLNKPLDFISYGFSVSDVEPSGCMHGFYLYRVNPLHSALA